MINHLVCSSSECLFIVFHLIPRQNQTPISQSCLEFGWVYVGLVYFLHGFAGGPTVISFFYGKFKVLCEKGVMLYELVAEGKAC